jgi:hypothetical protein
LAGFATEHLLIGQRARQLDREVRFSLLALRDSDLAAAFAGSDETDGHRAVQAVLQLGLLSEHEIAQELARFYAAARASLVAVWPGVHALAKALLRHQELDTEGVLEAIRGIDVTGPVLAVQRASFAPPKAGPKRNVARDHQ